MNNYEHLMGAHDIIADFNAKVGKEHTYLCTIGRRNIHVNTNTNDMSQLCSLERHGS